MANDIESAKKNYVNLQTYLEARKDKLTELLPATLTPDRMIAVALAGASRNPRLLECSPASFYRAFTQVAQIGLEPDTPLQHAHLVPYWNSKINGYECQLIPGFRGLCELVRRSKLVKDIFTHVVHEGDEFRVTLGDRPRLVHEMTLGARGAMTHVYAVAVFGEEYRRFEVMTRNEVEAIRNKIKDWEKKPWTTHFDEMARKTVIRRICKTLPQSHELATALSLDGEMDEEIVKDAVGEVLSSVETAKEIVKEKVAESRQAIEVAPPEPEETAPESPAPQAEPAKKRGRKSKAEKEAEAKAVESTPEPEPEESQDEAPQEDDGFLPEPEAQDEPEAEEAPKFTGKYAAQREKVATVPEGEKPEDTKKRLGHFWTQLTKHLSKEEQSAVLQAHQFEEGEDAASIAGVPVLRKMLTMGFDIMEERA